MKTGLFCALILTACVSGSPVWAMADSEKLAAAVPVEVSEVVTGGTWSDGAANGIYRAMVVGDGQRANIVVQMLATEAAPAAPKVVKSIAIKEVAEKKVPNAFLAMDAEKENEMTLIVTSYGGGADQDISMYVKFHSTGAYEILPAPGEEPPVAEKKK